MTYSTIMSTDLLTERSQRVDDALLHPRPYTRQGRSCAMTQHASKFDQKTGSPYGLTDKFDLLSCK